MKTAIILSLTAIFFTGCNSMFKEEVGEKLKVKKMVVKKKEMQKIKKIN